MSKAREKTIGVLAGTFIDSRMGVEFLQAKGLKSLAFPLSKSPKEQSHLQFFSEDLLEKKVIDIVKQAKEKGIEDFFLYCNSLSSSLDTKKISRENNINIITPLYIYEKIAKKYSKLFIMTANGQASRMVERIFEENNPNIRLYSLSILALVEAIEEGLDPEDIFEKFAMNQMISFVEENRLEAILLACTHFPYIEKILKEKTALEIINPAEGMYNKLMENL